MAAALTLLKDLLLPWCNGHDSWSRNRDPTLSGFAKEMVRRESGEAVPDLPG